MVSGEEILVVEDTQNNLDLTTLLLEEAGYRVLPARNAEEALSILQTTRPSLILMDLQLPVVDGLELTRRIKADPDRRDIPILAHTAYAMREDEQRALAAGCDGYLSKPVPIRTLLGSVRAHLSPAR